MQSDLITRQDDPRLAKIQRNHNPEFKSASELEARLLIDSLDAALAREPRWTCFHCGFETKERAEASNHFGDRDDESPICIVWQELDADGKASQYQSALGELAAERDENIKYRSTIEGLEYRLLEFENLLGSRFKGCRSINDAFNLYDSMEGRALLAEEQLADALEREKRLSEALEEIASHASQLLAARIERDEDALAKENT